MKSLEEHKKYVEGIIAQMRTIAQDPTSKRINFIHGSTNSTRTEENKDFAFVDITNLNDVIEINTRDHYALVEPNVALDKLLQSTLEYNLIPEVIAEFPGITVGGAVNGASLESSSFKYGQFNDTAEEYEIVLASGDVIQASKGGNSDLFYGISGSYGTLGLLTLIKLRLTPSKKYAKLMYEPTSSHQECLDLLYRRCTDNSVDYTEAVIFDTQKGVVLSALLTDDAGDLPIRTYSHSSDAWFYLQAQKVASEGKHFEEAVPIADYLFRYNRGAFWMGEYVFDILHLPHQRMLRHLLNPIMNTRNLYKALHATNLSQQYFIQDFYVPLDRTLEFIKKSDEELGIFPIWLCPMKPTQTPQKLSPHFLTTDLIIDVGIWGQSEKYLKDPINLNEKFEQYARDVGGRKMLYAHAYYSQDEFWKIYDHAWYQELRKKYHAEKAFPEIWEKVHVAPHHFEVHMLKGITKFLIEMIEQPSTK
ncbi:MAG: FAD-binding protein [Patescibacteria group bacterium]